MKKIAADRNYKNYHRVKRAGLGDLWDVAKMVGEVIDYAQSLAYLPAVPMTVLYQHGGSLLELFGRVKDSQGVPQALKAVFDRMVELNLITAEDTARG